MVSRACFEQTALVHRELLRKIAVKMTRNEDDAQDLVQETLLKAFRFFDTYEPGTNCKAWLCKILKNSFINHYRKRSKCANEVDFDDIEETRESQVQGTECKRSNPEETLLNAILKADVRETFVKLPPRYRGALSLSLVGGYSYREIASMMDCPVGTVMSRIHRGRELAQKRLFRHAEGRSWVAPPGHRTQHQVLGSAGRNGH